jgi:hypothetical protein
MALTDLLFIVSGSRVEQLDVPLLLTVAYQGHTHRRVIADGSRTWTIGVTTGARRSGHFNSSRSRLDPVDCSVAPFCLVRARRVRIGQGCTAATTTLLFWGTTVYKCRRFADSPTHYHQLSVCPALTENSNPIQPRKAG